MPKRWAMAPPISWATMWACHKFRHYISPDVGGRRRAVNKHNGLSFTMPAMGNAMTINEKVFFYQMRHTSASSSALLDHIEAFDRFF